MNTDLENTTTFTSVLLSMKINTKSRKKFRLSHNLANLILTLTLFLK